MDTTRDITYRGYKINDALIQTNTVPGGGIGSGVTGCVVNSIDMSDVDVVQYTEKRSEQDGMDAGSVFLGTRRIRMSGTVYGQSRPQLYDNWMALRAALSPVLAQRESPADKGYRPLNFTIPTTNTAPTTGFPSAEIDLFVYALPRALQAVFQDDAQGGRETDALAISWQASFVCKNPAIMLQYPYDITFPTIGSERSVTGASSSDILTANGHGLVLNDRVRFNLLTGGVGLATNTDYYVISANLAANTFMVSASQGGSAVNFTSDVTAGYFSKTQTQSGNTVNRGSYICPVNALWLVGPRAGSISVQVGDSVFSVAVPASSNSRIVRFKGQDKVITIDELGVELPRMDVITFSGSYTWPLISTGTAGYSVTFSGLGSVDPTSHLWFYESFA